VQVRWYGQSYSADLDKEQINVANRLQLLSPQLRLASPATPAHDRLESDSIADLRVRFHRWIAP
jgi:hypothetical protein